MIVKQVTTPLVKAKATMNSFFRPSGGLSAYKYVYIYVYIYIYIYIYIHINIYIYAWSKVGVEVKVLIIQFPKKRKHFDGLGGPGPAAIYYMPNEFVTIKITSSCPSFRRLKVRFTKAGP
jgi:hypothetical protein